VSSVVCSSAVVVVTGMRHINAVYTFTADVLHSQDDGDVVELEKKLSDLEKRIENLDQMLGKRGSALDDSRRLHQFFRLGGSYERLSTVFACFSDVRCVNVIDLRFQALVAVVHIIRPANICRNGF